MDLINDLGTDLALAFIVEKRFGKRIASEDAAKLIDRIRRLLEASTSAPSISDHGGEDQIDRLRASHA